MTETNAAPVAAERSAMQIDYEDGPLSLNEMAKKYQTTVSAISGQRERFDWKRRRKSRAGTRKVLIIRMFAVLESQLSLLETNMKSAGDKEVTVLGNLARTLEKLIEIETAQRPPRSTKAHSQQMHDVRKQLEKRINDLTKP